MIIGEGGREGGRRRGRRGGRRGGSRGREGSKAGGVQRYNGNFLVLNVLEYSHKQNATKVTRHVHVPPNCNTDVSYLCLMAGLLPHQAEL